MFSELCQGEFMSNGNAIIAIHDVKEWGMVGKMQVNRLRMRECIEDACMDDDRWLNWYFNANERKHTDLTIKIRPSKYSGIKVEEHVWFHVNILGFPGSLINEK